MRHDDEDDMQNQHNPFQDLPTAGRWLALSIAYLAAVIAVICMGIAALMLIKFGWHELRGNW